MLADRERRCGLDFYGDPDHPTTPPARTRTRDTLGIMPRGRWTGDRQHLDRQTGQMVPNNPNGYAHDAVYQGESNLTTLINDGLAALGSQLSLVPTRDRLILTAHSGGGYGLQQLIGLGHDPNEIHLFDGLYGGAVQPIIDWARRRITADASAISGMSDEEAARYMQSAGGALRVFYIGTATLSQQVGTALDAALDSQPAILLRHYRVQRASRSGADHDLLERKLGWQLMQDSGADVSLNGTTLIADAGDTVTDDSPAYQHADASAPAPSDGVVGAYAGPFPRRLGSAESYAEPDQSRSRGRRYGAVTAGRQEVYEPLIHNHWPHTGTASGSFRASTGSDANVVLLWNDISASSLSTIDVVVHFHGWRHPWLSEANQFTGMAPHQKEGVSGIVLTTRARPTLAILPRGKQGKGTSMSFPQLAGTNLQTLIDDSLDWFATNQLGQPAGSLSVCRLIFTGHSGGGGPLQDFAASHDPHEEHVYDALYGDADGVNRIAGWAQDRIARDATALAGISAQTARESYMLNQGGACRVFYLPDDSSDGTGRRSKALHQELTCAIRNATSDSAIQTLLTTYYRVEIAKLAHEDIPGQFEQSLLGWGASRDIYPTGDAPSTTCPAPTRTRPSITRRSGCDTTVPTADGSYLAPIAGSTPYMPDALRADGAMSAETLWSGEPYPRGLDGDDPVQLWEPRVADAEAKAAQGFFRHVTQMDLVRLNDARHDFEDANEAAQHDDLVRRLSAAIAAIRAWILDTTQSAIGQVPDATQRQHFLTGVNWSQQSFPGSAGARQQEAAALFDAIEGVCHERRITRGATRLPFHDISARLATVPGTNKRLFGEANEAFANARPMALQDGVTLTILSAYRSETDQQRIRARSSNPSAVAQGTSPHTYGLAMDLALSVPGLAITEIDTHSMPNMVSMYSSPVYKWMFVNGEVYGWFPYRKEPWHWEYNPPGFAPRYAAP